MKKILLFTLLMLVSFTYAGTITSLGSGNWSAGGTWVGGSVPGDDDDVVIAAGHVVTVDTADQCTSVTLNASTSTLTLNANLTVTGNTTNAGTINVTSGNYISTGASATFTNNKKLYVTAGYYLEMQGTSSTLTNNRDITTYATSALTARIIIRGTFTEDSGEDGTYARYVNGVGDVGTSNGWDLIGAPTTDTSINSFTTSENAGEIATSGSGVDILYGVGFYEGVDSDWETYGGSNTENSIAVAGNFDTGKGYQMATDNGGVVEFTGTLHTGDTNQSIRSYDADGDGGSNGSRWDIVANPYMSFIRANDNETANNVLTVNSGLLHLSNVALYFWDGDSYVAVNHSSSSSTYDYIAPMQGFLVAPKYTGSAVNFSFTKIMQTTSGTDDAVLIQSDIQDPEDNGELHLGISQNEINRKTEIYFNDGGSDGLDPGYDAAAFATFATYLSTRLVDSSQNEGENFTIQTLAYDQMWDKVVPLVLNAVAGEEVVVNIIQTNIPADLNIFLEDAQEGTYTNLKQEDFVMTPTSDLSDAGRFYIHFTADTLSDGEVNTSLLNAYKKVDSNYITIEGLSTQVTSTEVSLFNILGTKVMDAALDNNTNTQMISTNGLSTGIYVIKLESGQNQLTKKLIIK